MQQNRQQNIVLVLKKGGDFHFSDVELLARHIEKYWDVDEQLNIICLTDIIETPCNIAGVQCIPLEYGWKGWWSKLELFKPAMEQYRPFIYFDLDTAVVGNLSRIMPKVIERDLFIGIEDFYRPGKYANAMMWIPKNNEKVKRVWNRWISDPVLHMKLHKGDMQFIGATVSADQYWQRFTNCISSFKPKGHWLSDKPNHLSVVCFHGVPRIPAAALRVEWVRKYMEEI
jgi:hypothetical protein